MDRFGKPGIASWGPDRIDVLLRSSKSALIHVWRQGGATFMLDMGGQLESDPVAVTRGDKRLDVFARDTAQNLLWWTWSEERQSLVGPQALPGFIVTDPIPVALGTDKLMVFALSIDGPLRYWTSSVDADGIESFGRPEVRSVLSPGQPAIVARTANIVGVIIPLGDSGMPEYWEMVDGVWKPPIVLPGAMSHAPVAVTYLTSGDQFPRVDVYVRGDNDKLAHWGRGFLSAPGSPSGWFGPEASVPQPMARDPVAISSGDDRVELLVQDSGALKHWSWNPTTRQWSLNEVGDSMASDPAAISCAPGTIDVFGWGGDTHLEHWFFANGLWTFEIWPLTIIRPAPPQDELAQGLDDDPPDYLVMRAADQLLLGLHAPGFAPADEGALALVAEAPDARLIVTFPPQHVVESVIAQSDPPFSPSAITDARLSGPSRIGFVPAGATVELTASGILESMRAAGVSTDAALTRIELPFGIAFTPDTAGHAVAAVHATEPLDLDGTTGLWHTELHPPDPAERLQLAHVLAGRAEPFRAPLGKAERFLIKSQATPALARRLALSSAGGTLDAQGRWPTFAWDHRAALGRDQEVRTATEGVLFPLGHRAVFEQVTLRSTSEPTAVLRQSSQLTILEPVRRHRDATGQPELVNGFPFDTVEITTRTFSGLDDPDWKTVERESLSLAEYEQRLAEVQMALRPVMMAIHGGDMGFQGGPVAEDLALDGNPDARDYIALTALQTHIVRTIAMLKASSTGSESVPVHFRPTIDEKPVSFPLRCTGHSPDLHFDMPLLFVADLDLRGDLREPFVSLNDKRVLAQLQQAMIDSQDGVVTLPGVPINLAPEPATAPDTRRAGLAPSVSLQCQEVRRINIVGNALDGGFLPTLGLPPLPGLPPVPGLPPAVADPRAWAADIGMASLRSLLRTDPAVRIQYAADYLSSRVSAVPFGILGALAGIDPDAPLDPLKLKFSEAKETVGALAAPDMLADGISRAHGLINTVAQNLDGLGHLDPHQLFDEGASLLGFDLRELVQNVQLPPQITQLMVPGAPPTIEMRWEGIALTAAPAEHPNFKPAVDSRLNIVVLSSPELNQTSCTLGPFAIVMPAEETLIQVDFASLSYRQVLGEAPVIQLGALSVELKGKLALLQALQDNVGLGRHAPKIHVDATQAQVSFQLPIPDVTAFSFVMSNLVFSAGLTVPFTADPVALRLGFATREKPFTLTVLMFGGGGYVDLELTHAGLRRLEVSLQFGAAVALNFGIGRAEVHAFGGIRYALLPDGAGVSLTGFIHLGGSVDLLGLVSVAVELKVELEYLPENVLVGQAKLVIEVDLTLYSHKFELDSGKWTIYGGPPDRQRLAHPPQRFVAALPPKVASLAGDTGLDAWKAYRSNFS